MNSNTIRVIAAVDKSFIRGANNEHKCKIVTGNNIKSLVREAISIIENMGEGAAFRIEKNYGGNKDTIKCGEIKHGQYYPRNNF